MNICNAFVSVAAIASSFLFPQISWAGPKDDEVKIPKKSVDGSAVSVRFTSNFCELSSIGVAQKRGNDGLGKDKYIRINTLEDSEITKVKKLAPGDYVVTSIGCQTGIYPNLYGVQIIINDNQTSPAFTVKAGEITYLGDIDFEVTSPESDNKNPLFRGKTDVFLSLNVTNELPTAFESISKKKRKKGLPPMQPGLIKLIKGPTLAERFG